jgi:UDP-GlcNAc:undecaprenyl-phosphate GlcNAc-1-phosphate transferase
VFGAAEISLRVGGNHVVMATAGAEPTGASETFESQFMVPGGKAVERTLEIKWQDGRREIDRDTEIAIDILCEYIANALDGLQERLPVELTPETRIGPTA